jgi:predicted small lipoprotein YifL
MTNLTNKLAAMLCLGLLATAVGCKEQGPLERAGEEIDEAVDTAKNGGKESTATKVDDAADEIRDGVKDASKDLKK